MVDGHAIKVTDAVQLVCPEPKPQPALGFQWG
jgi:hypothetical protein